MEKWQLTDATAPRQSRTEPTRRGLEPVIGRLTWLFGHVLLLAAAMGLVWGLLSVHLWAADHFAGHPDGALLAALAVLLPLALLGLAGWLFARWRTVLMRWGEQCAAELEGPAVAAIRAGFAAEIAVRAGLLVAALGTPVAALLAAKPELLGGEVARALALGLLALIYLRLAAALPHRLRQGYQARLSLCRMRIGRYRAWRRDRLTSAARPRSTQT